MSHREDSEFWDLYTKDRERTGRLHRRGSQMSFGKMVISPALGRREDFSSLKEGKAQRET